MMSYMRELSVDVCDEVVSTSEWDRLRNGTYFGPNVTHNVMSCNEAFNIGHKKSCHISQAYAEMIGVSLAPHEILPKVHVPDRQPFWIVPDPETMVISPNSASNDRKGDGFSGNKVAPWTTWFKLFEMFRKEGRVKRSVFLLGPEDPIPSVPIPVQRLSLDQAVRFIYDACQSGGIYAGVDNGITHIAAGLRVPVFCIYCEGIAEHWVSYSSFQHYRIAKVNPAHCRHTDIWAHWRGRLRD
jgi:ADP-heptose:LPS heptosyltransferase